MPQKQASLRQRKGKISAQKRQHLADMVAARQAKRAADRAASAADAPSPPSQSTSHDSVTEVQLSASRKKLILHRQPSPSHPSPHLSCLPQPSPSSEPSPPHQPSPPSEPSPPHQLSPPSEPSPPHQPSPPSEPSPPHQPSPPSEPSITTMMEVGSLWPLLAPLPCPECLTPGLQVTYDTSRCKGFALFLQLVCKRCGIQSQSYSSGRSKCDTSMAVNRKVVAAGLTVGMGHAALNRFSEAAGMPGMQAKSFNVHVDAISKCVPAVSAALLERSRQKVVTHFRKNQPSAFDAAGILDVAVSFDGTWGTRGHTSKSGCGAVIEVMTGLVIDYHVMSLYCQTCATTGEKKKAEGEVAFKRWQEAHKPTCQQNYEGSSGGMEVEAAKTLWSRSLDHQMRYTVLVGDGDTKTFLALTTLRPYGNKMVRKQECVNHVAKRLNTALRNLVSTCTKKSVRLGGKAKGSLTQAKIGLLQSYYTRAVRTYNSSVEDMSRGIWAAFFHSVSTDENPQHDNCPDGPESWCWYQRALAAGKQHPTLGKGQSSTFMSDRVAEHVKPVYERLTDPELLERCLLGKTQNVNESLHSLIWARCPKHMFVGLKRVQIATLLAVGEFNEGSLATALFMKALDCPVSQKSIEKGGSRDKLRVQKADRAVEKDQRARREKRKAAQAEAQAAAEDVEGGPSYLPGGFF